MNKVMDWLKSIRLDRVLTVFLVGILLFVSTACSSGASAKTADELREEVPGSAVTNEYKGGMNDYSDVDPRFNEKGAEAKAKGLVDNAQRNINEKSIDSPEQYVENYRSGTPLDERVKRLGEDVGESAKDIGKEAAKGSKENAQNAKEASQSAAQSTKQAANETADTAKSKVKDDVKNTQRAVDKATGNAENIGDKIKQAAQDAADAVQSVAK
jgi:AAA ATPase containing von Willebrand factor type A (vWA) domain